MQNNSVNLRGKKYMTIHKVLRGLVSIIVMLTPTLAKTEVPIQEILKPMPKNLPKLMTDEDVTYTIIPETSGLNYRINVFDISKSVPAHYHEYQTQDIMVLEGKLKVHLDNADPIILEPSDKVQIPPKVWHVLEPFNGPVRYISTYFFDAKQHPTGLPFPEDVNFVRRPE